MRVLVTGGSGFIGTHLLDSFLAKAIAYINIDILEPKKPVHNNAWCHCNILDKEKLKYIFADFQPSHVVHLAARATTEGRNLDDFKDNTVGTANVIEAIKVTSCVSRVVVTSSQHVRKPGSGYPTGDQDYVPHGLYGESKAITEQLTHHAGLDCIWTIIRPTTIWGPYHPFLPQGLWAIMRKGLYLHPKNDPVIRSYGYVKNVVWQIEKILQAPSKMIANRVFYVGEKPVKQVYWINAFSKAIRGSEVTKIPKLWIRLIALCGDSLGLVGIKFPMDSSRYFNLTTTNPVPLGPIYDGFGDPPYSLDEGIKETVQWLYSYWQI